MSDSSLNAARRERELEELVSESVVDVLVIGLGVTGAGVALDAASRGLSVAAIDANDLAFGTSRWSSKLVHGGLRYLAKGQIGIARESAVERGILMTRTAPHLIRPLPMTIPLMPALSKPHAALSYAGMLAGDALRISARTPASVLPRPQRINAAAALRLASTLQSDHLRGALVSWDGQLDDDARLVIAIARTAAHEGAKILTKVRALAVDGSGAQIRDEMTGSEHQIRARSVINATGVWANQLVPGIALRPSRGTHLVVPSAALGFPKAAITAPVPGEFNRFVFALPQADGRVYIGLTDDPVPGPIPDVPAPGPDDMDFLLTVINTVLAEPLTHTDVIGSYAGLRPLLDADGRTADISRKHAVLTSPDGVITIIGGKLTTYRAMAEHALDAALRQHGMAAGQCRTAQLPLVGAGPLPAKTNIDPRLLRRYGSEAPALVENRDLAHPLADGIATVPAEFAWAVAHEGALTVDDLLDRRTRIGLVPTDREKALPLAQEFIAAR